MYKSFNKDGTLAFLLVSRRGVSPVWALRAIFSSSSATFYRKIHTYRPCINVMQNITKPTSPWIKLTRTTGCEEALLLSAPPVKFRSNTLILLI